MIISIIILVNLMKAAIVRVV